MARKIKRPEPQTDELAILQPNRTLPLGDRNVTVRELGFFESLRLHESVAALVGGLVGLTDDGNIDLDRLHRVCALHPDATVELLSQASDQSVEWVHSLNAAQGDLLLMTFWAVNADFFLQRVLAALETRRAVLATTGPASSPR
ncbi:MULTISPECIES: DUF6631 family protein [unclassified Lysobacter]|uniref:DUF6631 family protein n=1 Tax=unclassified Lysobacter TaxID=2635362 RepID=UPI001BE738A6|nr:MULTISPECIES: DUF6631 family protein [unclassified Lysobacter]MBT2748580.1 hypothetical protein [Lysobacter sp. ISL-42]MBT2751515.1 hypothetical protein [Lysobacter sp. ISL-50]MBT2775709.1 hypothetical protein [Lysobacter sp. ISL-54]MBT2782326.1 hypothetical protein [Lysobacter sp. ISL-52]